MFYVDYHSISSFMNFVNNWCILERFLYLQRENYFTLKATSAKGYFAELLRLCTCVAMALTIHNKCNSRAYNLWPEFPRGTNIFRNAVLWSDTRVYTTIVNRTMLMSWIPQEAKYLTVISLSPALCLSESMLLSLFVCTNCSLCSTAYDKGYCT